MENIKNILDKDWLKFVCQKYKEIPENDRRAFWIIFATLNLMFIFHTINFLWATDDWWPVKIKAFVWGQAFEGRFGVNLIKTVFFHGQILPIINNVFAFLGFSLGAIALFKYWELDNKVKYFVIAGVMFVCSPFSNAWLHYTHALVEHLWAILFITLGLKLAIKYKISDGVCCYFATNIISIFLILFSLTIYQPFINMIMIVLLGKLFIKSVEGKFKELLIIFRNSVVNIGFALFLYFSIYKICEMKNIVDASNYNQGLTNSISLFAYKLGLAFNAILVELFNYERILMPKIITKLFFVITIIAVVSCFIKILSERTEVLKKLAISTLIFGLLLLSTQISQIISLAPIFNMPRILFQGILVFDIFMLVLVFKYAKIGLKNITYLICIILFFEYITVNFVSQKSFKFATTSEMLTYDKIVALIEEQPKYSSQNKYDFFVIGKIPVTRPFYVGKYEGSDSFELGNGSITPWYSPMLGLNFYNNINLGECYTYVVFNDCFSYENINDNPNKDILLKTLKRHIVTLSPWPAKNCVTIDNDLIILVLDGLSFNKFKEEYGLSEVSSR